MKIDNNSFGTDNAALVQNLRIEFRLSTPAYNYTEDTRLLFQYPSHSSPNMGIPPSRFHFLKKGKMRETFPLSGGLQPTRQPFPLTRLTFQHGT
jgi:hypothetical protein